jgi:hypothetical protein
MSWVSFGEDLYAFMDALDITSVVPEGWAYKFNRPPKSDERPEYPVFAVVPARDDIGPLDNITDDVTLTYSVYIFFSYWDAGVAEEEIRALVDLVRTELAKERRSTTPLGGSYTLSFTGEWGGDETQTERYYRLDVTARCAADLEP